MCEDSVIDELIDGIKIDKELQNLTDDQLKEKLEKLVIKRLIVSLSDPECSPAMVNAALRCLDQMHIESIPTTGSEMEELINDLSNKIMEKNEKPSLKLTGT